MEKHYKEKHLQATLYKIENVKREQNFLIKNIWKVIGFGIVFVFWAPTYSSGNTIQKSGRSILEKSQNTYLEMVFICTLVYVVLCFLYHFSSKYQDKKRLKTLTKLKSRLEQEIEALS